MFREELMLEALETVAPTVAFQSASNNSLKSYLEQIDVCGISQYWMYDSISNMLSYADFSKEEAESLLLAYMEENDMFYVFDEAKMPHLSQEQYNTIKSLIQ